MPTCLEALRTVSLTWNLTPETKSFTFFAVVNGSHCIEHYDAIFKFCYIYWLLVYIPVCLLCFLYPSSSVLRRREKAKKCQATNLTLCHCSCTLACAWQWRCFQVLSYLLTYFISVFAVLFITLNLLDLKVVIYPFNNVYEFYVTCIAMCSNSTTVHYNSA